VLVCSDELIIFSADAESHLHHLDDVTTLLGPHGVTLKAQKSHFCIIEVVSLWKVVRARRLIVNEKNLESIKRVSFPMTKTQLRSSLGIHNVYRRCNVDFSKTAKPLHELNSVVLPKPLNHSIPLD